MLAWCISHKLMDSPRMCYCMLTCNLYPMAMMATGIVLCLIDKIVQFRFDSLVPFGLSRIFASRSLNRIRGLLSACSSIVKICWYRRVELWQGLWNNYLAVDLDGASAPLVGLPDTPLFLDGNSIVILCRVSKPNGITSICWFPASRISWISHQPSYGRSISCR